MGMIRWEWEGNGNKKVISAHLYYVPHFLNVSPPRLPPSTYRLVRHAVISLSLTHVRAITHWNLCILHTSWTFNIIVALFISHGVCRPVALLQLDSNLIRKNFLHRMLFMDIYYMRLYVCYCIFLIILLYLLLIFFISHCTICMLLWFAFVKSY